MSGRAFRTPKFLVELPLNTRQSHPYGQIYYNNKNATRAFLNVKCLRIIVNVTKSFKKIRI